MLNLPLLQLQNRKVDLRAHIGFRDRSAEISRCESSLSDNVKRDKANPAVQEEGVIKKLLERIDNAVKKSNRGTFPYQNIQLEASKKFINEKLQKYIENMEWFNHNSIDMEYHQIPRIKSLQKKWDDKIYSYSVINESNKKENEKFIIGSQQYSNNEFKRNLDQLSTLNFDKK